MNTSSLSLGERMKCYYEEAYKITLPWRMPVVLRFDGRAFHTFTRGMDKPFDDDFIQAMVAVSLELCGQVMGCALAYVQSDEISLLLHNYRRIESQAWFANELQKCISVSAGMASSVMSLQFGHPAVFDARAFVLPEAEVCNYFIWRQQDATRNSVQGYAQSLYSPKQLRGKNKAAMMDMMMDKGMNWNDLPVHKKRGLAIRRDDSGWEVDLEPPIFTQDRGYIEDLLRVDDGEAGNGRVGS